MAGSADQPGTVKNAVDTILANDPLSVKKDKLENQKLDAEINGLKKGVSLGWAKTLPVAVAVVGGFFGMYSEAGNIRTSLETQQRAEFRQEQERAEAQNKVLISRQALVILEKLTNNDKDDDLAPAYAIRGIGDVALEQIAFLLAWPDVPLESKKVASRSYLHIVFEQASAASNGEASVSESVSGRRARIAVQLVATLDQVWFDWKNLDPENEPIPDPIKVIQPYVELISAWVERPEYIHANEFGATFIDKTLEEIVKTSQLPEQDQATGASDDRIRACKETSLQLGSCSKLAPRIQELIEKLKSKVSD